MDTDSAERATAASAAQLGERDGRACRRHGRDIPPLAGGAYAVGFLYGYAAEGRRLLAPRQGAAA